MALVVEPRIERKTDGITVWFHWKGTEGEVIDRPECGGISVGKPSPKAEMLARRVSAALRAQKLFGPAELATDIFGKTYVRADCRVIGRRLNADLIKIGF